MVFGEAAAAPQPPDVEHVGRALGTTVGVDMVYNAELMVVGMLQQANQVLPEAWGADKNISQAGTVEWRWWRWWGQLRLL